VKVSIQQHIEEASMLTIAKMSRTGEDDGHG
jgi:hypothetical protein